MALKMYQETGQNASPRVQHVIAIAAGKGGVGKSSVTVNLALALKHLGYAVGVMDTDIYGPSIRKMLPEDTLPGQKGETIIPAICKGIKMISMAYFRKDFEAAAVRAPIANGVVTQFIKNVEWDNLDFLLIDFPPGTGDIQLTLSQQANLSGAVMVTTPQEVAILDVRKAMNLFDQVKVPILGIVENMSYYYHKKTDETLYLFGKGGGERLARESGVPFLGSIPIDPIVCQSGDRGQSIFATENPDNSHMRTVFIELANQVKEHVTKSGSGDPVRQIRQKNDQSFEIEWSDGTINSYRLSDLQKQCPCANCVDETTGKRIVDPSRVNPDVGAVRITNVGRYAIKIQFTTGCSTGIYSFDMLRNFGKELAK